jgi:hypothetical protein
MTISDWLDTTLWLGRSMGVVNNPIRSEESQTRREGLERGASEGVDSRFFFLFFENGKLSRLGRLYISMESFVLYQQSHEFGMVG